MRLSCSRLSSRPTTLPLLENFRPTTSRLCIAGSLPRFATSAQRFISVSFVSSRPHSAMDTNVATTTTPTTDSIAPASTSKVGSEVVATHDEATAVEKKDLHEKKKKKKKDDDGVYLPFKIAAAVPISPDTKLFRFQVPADQAQLLRTLPSPVSHIALRATLPPLPHDPTTSELRKRRPYTILRRFPAPGQQQTTPDEEDQHVEVMIKRYDTFGLSAHLHSLKEGDTVELQLVGKDKHAKMNFPEIHLRHKHIGIVTAGTALAPMISIMRSVLYNAEANDTRVTLLYANRHEEDILLRKELEELWEAYQSRLTVYFLLSQPRSESWGPQTSPYQLRGRITKDMFKETLPLPAVASSSSSSSAAATSEEAPNVEQQQTDPLVLVCGPKPFKKLALQFLEELNFTPNMFYKL